MVSRNSNEIVATASLLERLGGVALAAALESEAAIRTAVVDRHFGKILPPFASVSLQICMPCFSA
jgi:hypothetical protein